MPPSKLYHNNIVYEAQYFTYTVEQPLLLLYFKAMTLCHHSNQFISVINAKYKRLRYAHIYPPPPQE